MQRKSCTVHQCSSIMKKIISLAELLAQLRVTSLDKVGKIFSFQQVLG